MFKQHLISLGERSVSVFTENKTGMDKVTPDDK